MIMQYDISYSELQNYKGFGYHSLLGTNLSVPIPEVALPFEMHDYSKVTEIRKKIKATWINNSYNKFLTRLPNYVYRNKNSNPEFISGYNKYSVLELPLEDLCGIDKEITKVKKRV